MAKNFQEGRGKVKSPKPKILLFFNDNRFLKEISSWLGREGFITIIASRGFEVYDKSLSDQPDLVVATSQMPSSGFGSDMITVISLLRGQGWVNPVILYGPRPKPFLYPLAEQAGSVEIVDEDEGVESLKDKVEKILEKMPA